MTSFSFFFFNDTATTEIYTLSLHDALPISGQTRRGPLNTDDVGAPVRELPDTGWASPRDRQIDDADVVQRKLRGHVALHPCPGGFDETVECQTWQPMQLLQR